MAADSTVIIVSYRPGDWLGPCIDSAGQQASEVIVVDNGSDRDEASQVARARGAQPVRLTANRGFAGGVAAGLARARGDVIGVLNDDATAAPNWLSAASHVLGDPSVAAVTPKVVLSGVYAEVTLDEEPWRAPPDPRVLGRIVRSVTVDGQEMLAAIKGAGMYDLEQGSLDGEAATWRWTAGRVPFYVPMPEPDTGLPVVIDGEEHPTGQAVRLINHAGSFLRAHGVAGEYGLGAPDDGRFDHRAERFGFSATAPVFRAETLHRLGAFAPEFFAYNEDTDWCLRARLAGLRIVYDPTAAVTHRLSATSGGVGSDTVRRLARRNALLCMMRNAPFRVAGLEFERAWSKGLSWSERKEVASRVPWALSSRLRLRRQWTLTPRQVWTRWAEADTTWDTSPAGCPPAS